MRGAPRGGCDTLEDRFAWERARDLCREITVLDEQPPISQRYSFRGQIHRAAAPVMSNVAEGFDRGSRAEFHYMLSIAKGSCAEVRSLLYVALDATYIDDATFTRLGGLTDEVSRVIGGLRTTVGRQRAADRSSA